MNNSLNTLKDRWLARADRLLGYPALRLKFRQRHLRFPDLRNPRGFSEKIQWRKLHDRNPMFPILADKLRYRGFVEERLGSQRAGELLPRLIWSGESAANIPFDLFDEGAVLKANHGSGWNHVILPGQTLDWDAVRRKCDRWLDSRFGVERQEWAYSEIPPRLLAEELLQGWNGGSIADLKAYVFDGKLTLFHLIENEQALKQGLRGLFRPDWTRPDATIHMRRNEQECDIGHPPRPAYLDDLIGVAEELCKGFDMIRMDFLVSDTRFWIGEMTLYPASGIGFFAPEAFELEMGDKWRLPSENKG